MDFIGTATMTSRPPRATMRIRQASDARAVGVPPGRMHDCNWSLTGRCGYRNRRWLPSKGIFCCVIVTIHLSMTVVLRNAARENNSTKERAACRKLRRMWQAAGAPHRKWGQGTFVGKRHSDPAFGALPGLRHSSAVWTVDADVTQREKRVARVETKAKPGALCIVSKPLVFATLHPYQAICRS